MSTTHTPWDDTGFDSDDASEGFKSEPSALYPPTQSDLPAESVPTPEPTPVEPEPTAVTHEPTPIEPEPMAVTHEPTVVDEAPAYIPPATPAGDVVQPSAQYTRVEPRVVTTPTEQPKRSRWGTAVIALALLLIVLAGGYIVSTFFLRDATEQEAFYAETDQTTNNDAAAEIDTLTVAPQTDTMSANGMATNANKVDSSLTQQSVTDPKPSVIPEPKPRVAPKEKPERTEQEAKLAKPVPANALYVVQVFSSPSRDDADEWLQILRERSVANGFITEQRIGGESWYRVRFGQYSTRKDAEAAAQEYGFSNPWIARVR